MEVGHRLTLNANMDVVLRLLDVSCIFVGFGEGVCKEEMVSLVTLDKGWRGDDNERLLLRRSANMLRSLSDDRDDARWGKAGSPNDLRFSIVI